MKKVYELNVEYNGSFYYRGGDAIIENVLQRTSIGSGMGFGFRDLDFEYKTKKGRDNAIKRLKKLDKKMRIKTQVR